MCHEECYLRPSICIKFDSKNELLCWSIIKSIFGVWTFERGAVSNGYSRLHSWRAGFGLESKGKRLSCPTITPLVLSRLSGESQAMDSDVREIRIHIRVSYTNQIAYLNWPDVWQECLLFDAVNCSPSIDKSFVTNWAKWIWDLITQLIKLNLDQMNSKTGSGNHEPCWL